MKRLIKSFSFVLLLVFMFFMTSCAKSPDKGFVDVKEIDKLVSTFESSNYSTYSIDGQFNYYNKDIEPTYNATKEFKDSKDKYNKSCSSYYINVPLHITKENWLNEELGSNNLPISTKYHLEAKIYRIGGDFDKCYYYLNDDGGFSVKVYAANKNLKLLTGYLDFEIHAKWDITITYDKNGYLVSEEFNTYKANKEDKTNCIYGKATYKFS